MLERAWASHVRSCKAPQSSEMVTNPGLLSGAKGGRYEHSQKVTPVRGRLEYLRGELRGNMTLDFQGLNPYFLNSGSWWSSETSPIRNQQQGGLRNSKHESTLSSQEYVHELRSGITEEKLLNCLESLRVSLTSNPVSWVNNFGHDGLGLLLDALEKLLDKKLQESIDKRNQHKLIQCLKAFMNNKYGLQRILGDERSLLLLARAIDPKQTNMMTEIVKILSAFCIIGEENILDKILAAMTIAAERNNKERFAPIVEGLENHEAQQLQVACMQLINALKILPELKETEELDIQLKVFNENKEEDSIELSHRLDDIRAEMEYPLVLPCVNTLMNMPAELAGGDECRLWVWSSFAG
ncbi:unnamed protein product [Pleuronectes platessa]|uniref:GBD/FH3 domain-containing protein n=1 Tax=Pleuronectes platessa TaxID=8262 RepID=A0A9N7ZA06_PLEPL|nr:unnamed protein product [Pleuronectes platessa]